MYLTNNRLRFIFAVLAVVFAVTMLGRAAAASVTGPITANHMSVQAFSGLSPSSITAVKGMVLLNIGQSHGAQVPHGLETLESQNGMYGVTVYNGEITDAANGTLQVGTGLLLSDNTTWQTYNGPNEFWYTTTGLNNVRRTLDYYEANGITVDAILHTWCWHFQSWSASQVTAYFAAMEQLESEYPDITFIYMTDTDDSTGSAGYNRYQRNQQVRAYCAANDKIFYDFGELETWSATGLVQNTTTYGAYTFPYWHSDWAGDEYAHIKDAACTMKAKAMWWLMAQIANGAPTPAPVYRFYNFRQGVHFYTTNYAEKTYLESSAGNWTFRSEGSNFSAYTSQAADTVPVHRFYNFLQGVHFYTANQGEATYVNDHLWHTFRYENVAYYAYPTPATGRVPVYRFYNFLQGAHFYTTSAIEKAQLEGPGGNWTYRYENIAYYVPSSP